MATQIPTDSRSRRIGRLRSSINDGDLCFFVHTSMALASAGGMTYLALRSKDFSTAFHSAQASLTSLTAIFGGVWNTGMAWTNYRRNAAERQELERIDTASPYSPHSRRP
jgi:hypothetical protein